MNDPIKYTPNNNKQNYLSVDSNTIRHCLFVPSTEVFERSPTLLRLRLCLQSDPPLLELLYD